MGIWKEMCENAEKETQERKLNVLRKLFRAANECINEGLLLDELARFKNDVAKLKETENKTEEDDNKPQSWVQFCAQYPITSNEYYINKDSSIKNVSCFIWFAKGVTPIFIDEIKHNSPEEAIIAAIEYLVDNNLIRQTI